MNRRESLKAIGLSTVTTALLLETGVSDAQQVPHHEGDVEIEERHDQRRPMAGLPERFLGHCEELRVWRELGAK